MKILLICLLVLNFNPLLSQKDTGGIYFTASDYTMQKLSYAYNCNTSGDYISSNDIFHDKYIIVKYNGLKLKCLKDSVYALRYCDGSITRIVNGREYLLLNPNEPIMIYSIVTGPSEKGGTAKTTYYFTLYAEDELVQLTIPHIKLALWDNSAFQHIVDNMFRNDDELMEYDPLYKMTKLNLAFLNSMEQ